MDLLNERVEELILLFIVNLQLIECRGKILDSIKHFTYPLYYFLKGSKKEGRAMAEASAVSWFDINGELSSIQPATIELNPYLVLAIANHREEYHLNEVLKPSFNVGLPMINQTLKFILEVYVLYTFNLFPYLT